MRTSLSPYQEDILNNLYAQGKNDYEVAREMHLGRTRLREWRRAHDIPSKTTKRGLSADICSSIVDRLSKGATLTQVAEELSVRRTSISRLLKKNGFDYVVRSRPRPSYARDYVFSDIQRQVLVGEMFGDGGIASKSAHSAYYHCSHSIAQKEFVLWKHEIFQPMSAKIAYHTKVNKKGEELLYVGTRTWSCKFLRECYDKYYDFGRSREKVLTAELAQELTPLSLAVWFMGDGSKNRNTGVFHVGPEIILEPIADALSEKFSMHFSARRYEKEWHLRVMEPNKFFPLIWPHLLDIFKYKVPEQYRTISI